MGKVKKCHLVLMAPIKNRSHQLNKAIILPYCFAFFPTRGALFDASWEDFQECGVLLRVGREDAG